MTTTKTRSDFMEVFELLRRNIEIDLRVSAPGRVVTYDPATNKADIELGFLSAKKDGTTLPPVILSGVPVEWLRGSTGFVTTPLAPGSTGKLTFADRALENWLTKGAALDPKVSRTHSLSDAVFEPGLSPDTRPHPGGAVDQTATVVEGPLVKLGSGATVPVAKGTDTDAVLAQIITLLQTWTVVASDGGLALKTAALLLWPTGHSPVSATKTLAE